MQQTHPCYVTPASVLSRPGEHEYSLSSPRNKVLAGSVNRPLPNRAFAIARAAQELAAFERQDENLIEVSRKEGFLFSPVVRTIGVGSHVHRLLKYNEELRRCLINNSLEDSWEPFVRTFFAPRARMLLELLSNRTSASRHVELTVEAIPRVLKSKFDAGALDERLLLEDPCEFLLQNGVVLVQCPSTSVITHYAGSKVHAVGQLRVSFCRSMKILSWEFSTSSHEEMVSRSAVVAGRILPAPVCCEEYGLPLPMLREMTVAGNSCAVDAAPHVERSSCDEASSIHLTESTRAARNSTRTVTWNSGEVAMRPPFATQRRSGTAAASTAELPSGVASVPSDRRAPEQGTASDTGRLRTHVVSSMVEERCQLGGISINEAGVEWSASANGYCPGSAAISASREEVTAFANTEMGSEIRLERHVDRGSSPQRMGVLVPDGLTLFRPREDGRGRSRNLSGTSGDASDSACAGSGKSGGGRASSVIRSSKTRFVTGPCETAAFEAHAVPGPAAVAMSDVMAAVNGAGERSASAAGRGGLNARCGSQSRARGRGAGRGLGANTVGTDGHWDGGLALSAVNTEEGDKHLRADEGKYAVCGRREMDGGGVVPGQGGEEVHKRQRLGDNCRTKVAHPRVSLVGDIVESGGDVPRRSGTGPIESCMEGARLANGGMSF
jgi:LIM-domain binding protein